jgi:hypothetical protein
MPPLNDLTPYYHVYCFLTSGRNCFTSQVQRSGPRFAALNARATLAILFCCVSKPSILALRMSGINLEASTIRVPGSIVARLWIWNWSILLTCLAVMELRFGKRLERPAAFPVCGTPLYGTAQYRLDVSGSLEPAQEQLLAGFVALVFFGQSHNRKRSRYISQLTRRAVIERDLKGCRWQRKRVPFWRRWR